MTKLLLVSSKNQKALATKISGWFRLSLGTHPISLPKGIQLAQTYDEVFGVQGVSTFKKASPPPPSGAGAEDAEVAVQNRVTSPPPYTQQSATQLLASRL